jgi:tetratricopeptide (TPR) repeat protein
VLYLQGLLLLKQRQWGKPRKYWRNRHNLILRTCRLLPHSAWRSATSERWCGHRAAGKVPAAAFDVSWDTRWALAKAYYQRAHYDEALQMSQAALSASSGKAPEIQLLVAQSLTAVGRYEDAAQTLRDFLRDHSDRQEAATARRWLDRLSSSGKTGNK